MKSAKPRVVRKRLADGSIREYTYARFGKRGIPDPKSIGALILAYQRSPEYTQLARRTVEMRGLYLRPLGRLAHVAVKDIRRSHLLLIRDGIAAKRGHGAAAAFCAAASALFSFAIDREMVEHSPAKRLLVSLNAGTLPTWTMEQATRAMRELPEPFRRAVVLAFHTGQRRGDLCRLRWSAYDGDRITLTQEKTKQLISVPLVPELRGEMEAWKRETRGLTILETERGVPFDGQYLSARLPRELVKIGLPKGLNIHGLRKLAAVRLAEAGCSIHEIAAITGHKTLAMVQHYTTAANQVTLSDAAILKLENVNRQKPTSKPLKS